MQHKALKYILNIESVVSEIEEIKKITDNNFMKFLQDCFSADFDSYSKVLSQIARPCVNHFRRSHGNFRSERYRTW